MTLFQYDQLENNSLQRENKSYSEVTERTSRASYAVSIAFWEQQSVFFINPHETARYGEIASAILNFFVCCMEMG